MYNSPVQKTSQGNCIAWLKTWCIVIMQWINYAYSKIHIPRPALKAPIHQLQLKMKMEIHNKSEASCWRNLSTKIDTHFLYVRNFIYTFWLPWQQTCMTGSCPVWPWPGLTLGCRPGTKRNALGSHPLCDFGPDPSRTPT